ncbi:bifunctional lysylphosphatidylglycerol flippase/synthetase MprF [Rhodococcus sp. O3]|uniref:bifunctional lysylphosphatidylglycerol flippase/synthetase MprF n=1 Tax=Rhodococcus sp. O3 TaxID=3404919 RepID=UPI003B674933
MTAVLRRVPLTVTVCVALVVTGVVSGGLWKSVRGTAWFDTIAYGVPELRQGNLWPVFAGSWFGLTPIQYVSLVVLAAAGFGIGEWRLGTRATAIVAVAGQVVGVVGACGLIMLADTIGWAWAESLADVRDVGCTTAVVAVLAATTATVPSPWRLRTRALLYGYVIVSFLFLGSFADATHLVAFTAFLVVGERWLSRGERGLRPRTRREARLVASVGLWVIAAVHVIVYFFPGDGPFGPTAAHEASLWSTLVNVLIAGLLADQLRRGRRGVWWIVLGYALLSATATLLVLILVIATGFDSGGAVTAGTGLLWAGEAFLLIAGRSAFTVPWRRASGTEDVAVDDVRNLIRRHGGNTMSWMITWNDMHHFSTADIDGVIGYRRHAGALVALAGPIAADGERPNLIAAFLRFAESQAAMPCLFSVSEDTARVAEGTGWRTLQIAEDTIIDLPNLTLAGKKWQKVRSALNKAEKNGTECVLGRLSEQSDGILGQVREISEQWVGEKELPEMGFTLGTVEEALDDDVRVALAVDTSETVQAVLSWLPVYRGDGEIRGWTLDVMRKRNGPDTNNMIEFLIARSALAFKDEGAEFISLSGAPLARADQSAEIRGIDRGLDLLGQTLEPFYGFRSLHRFKAKFNPRYEPVFLCYRDEADLPRIGVALSRAFLPDATPRQMMALVQSARE